MQYDEFQAEATANGIRTGSMTIDYHDAIRRLDAGEFDTPNVRGLRILQCLAQADEAGLLGKLPVEMKVAQWRYNKYALNVYCGFIAGDCYNLNPQEALL